MDDLEPLIRKLKHAKIVMLGEASHGTHEYYLWRSYISRRLISEHGFDFIAVEGDWPDCYKLNRYVKGYNEAGDSANEVLHKFNRWPTWMWANWEITGLAEWMRKYNAGRPKNLKAGFYGLDVYSLSESLQALKNYLIKKDPVAWKATEKAMDCFEPYKDEDGQEYAMSMRLSPESCENEVVNMLATIRKQMPTYDTDHEAVFSVEQNALVAVNAESYYRNMVTGRMNTWNLRDKHMMDTLKRLIDFTGPKSKAIIWEHNTHIGDARATDMKRDGLFNIGELVRLEYGNNEIMLVGLGSHSGTVIASDHWDGEIEVMDQPKASPGTWEDIMHKAGGENRLVMTNEPAISEIFDDYIGHRAIGVVYHPEREKYGNYVPTVIPKRYDAFIYLDKTMALHPLHLRPNGHLMPETFPWGF